MQLWKRGAFHKDHWPLNSSRSSRLQDELDNTVERPLVSTPGCIDYASVLFPSLTELREHTAQFEWPGAQHSDDVTAIFYIVPERNLHYTK